MPTSSIEGKSWIEGVVARLRPEGVLDIGPGEGTYADLLRASTPDAHWSCVEVHEPYVERFDLRRKYDVVHTADIRSFRWPRRYDLVILGDILEHLHLADALSVWQTARMQAEHVVLSIPIVEYPQGPQNGNDHEAHLHTWTHASVVERLTGIRTWRCYSEIGVYLAGGSKVSDSARTDG